MKTIVVIGCGYVGEHLLQTFAKKQIYQVVGYDIDIKRVKILEDKYKNVKNVCMTSNFDAVSKLEGERVFLVSVPTLLDEKNEPVLEPLIGVRNKLEGIVRENDTIVVESSVYVGATRELFNGFVEMGVYVGFSPERVDPGRSSPSCDEIPKIISGLNVYSLNEIEGVYSKVFKMVVPVSSTECAEMCKLYENCFRMVNIAYVNEIADLCETYDINSQEMINASSTKPFGFMPFFPGLGVGGHCIPVNPYYLGRSGTLESLPVLKTAVKQTESRPEGKAIEIIKLNNGNRVLVVGMGFKPGESLMTNSPGLKLYRELKKRGKDVWAYDPLVAKTNETGIQWVRASLDKELINSFDIIVVATKQKNVDWKVIQHAEEYYGKTVVRF